MDRRDFLKTAVATTAAVSTGMAGFEAAAATPKFEKMIGLQAWCGFVCG